jgi:biotin-dependent carboxylase-like uncharacterized protein
MSQTPSALFRVDWCGAGASVQDAGRFGLQRYGVSPAGAMDREALALANALVGNPAGMAAIECPLAGFAGRVEEGRVLVAAAGGGSELSIAGRKLSPFTSDFAERGEIVTLGPARSGVFAYLAFGGGILSPPELGSLSVHRRSGLGGAPLRPGDVLPLGDAPVRARRLSRSPDAPKGPIRIVPGPQDDHAGAAALALLTSSGFTISSQADRMGVRLDGPKVTPAGGHDIVSDGIATGAIQLPGDGRPIVLLRDRQTTGGYPKIATVISADIGRFAQLQQGSAVRFTIVSRAEAIAAARAAADRIDGFAAAMTVANAILDAELLLSLNLIDGVTAGQ